MTNLLTTLGAEVEVDHTVNYPTADRLALAKSRAYVRNRILTCHACPLRDSGWVSKPVPFDGPIEPTFMVVGEAPGQNEDRQGRPFIGPAGQLLRAMISDAGLDPDAAAYMNAACCFPKAAPSDYTLKACRGHLDAQMALMPTPWVVLAGNVALHQFRDDLTVTKMNGHTFVRGGKVFMPILHPAFVLRHGKQGVYRDEVVGAFERLKDLVKGDAAPSWFFGDICSAAGCGEFTHHHDPEGVTWCRRHWDTRQQTPTEIARYAARVKALKVAQAKARARKKQQGQL